MVLAAHTTTNPYAGPFQLAFGRHRLGSVRPSMLVDM